MKSFVGNGADKIYVQYDITPELDEKELQNVSNNLVSLLRFRGSSRKFVPVPCR